MHSTAMTFKLKPGCYAEYKKAHDELWPEIADDLKARGCSMAIYHHEGRLFLHAVYPSKERAGTKQTPANAEAGARWSKYMASLMDCHEDGTAIVETLEPAFLFGLFAPGAQAPAPDR